MSDKTSVVINGIWAGVVLSGVVTTLILGLEGVFR